eukprot:TRINITY_DN1347_c0_g1_i4.p1 TRINITY_DN1347_c0_g1~~TRINITY_DN1347_c0_g1_i4.p1  ORF type:complete len:645 (+),score=145.20 TRINITY_DN1347_c0_g1_i4:386-2320(+)
MMHQKRFHHNHHVGGRRSGCFIDSTFRLRKCLLAFTLGYGLLLLMASVYFFVRWKLGILIPPMQVRNYKLTHVVGEGQAGIVYRAEDSKGKKVAIKQIRSDRVGNGVTADQEVRVAKRLHSFIGSSSSSSMPFPFVRFIEEFKTSTASTIKSEILGENNNYDAKGEQRWLVFEYMAGGSLKEHLESRNNNHNNDLQTARDVMCQLFKALELLTRLRIISRDVKPSNVFLSSSSQQQREGSPVEQGDGGSRRHHRVKVKWGDFGDAIILDDIRTENLRAWWWDTRKETPTTQFLRPEGIVQDTEMTIEETLTLLKTRNFTRSKFSSASLWGGEAWIWSHDVYGLASVLLSFPLSWSGARELDSRARSNEDEAGSLWDRVVSSRSEVNRKLLDYGGRSYVDLLSKLLNVNPIERISPVEALFHPFLYPSEREQQLKQQHETGDKSNNNDDNKEKEVVDDSQQYEGISRTLRSKFQFWANRCVTETSPYKQDSKQSRQQQQEQQRSSTHHSKRKQSPSYPTLRDCYPPPTSTVTTVDKGSTTEHDATNAYQEATLCKLWLRDATDCITTSVCSSIHTKKTCGDLVSREMQERLMSGGDVSGEDQKKKKQQLEFYCRYLQNYLCATFGSPIGDSESGFAVHYPSHCSL